MQKDSRDARAKHHRHLARGGLDGVEERRRAFVASRATDSRLRCEVRELSPSAEIQPALSFLPSFSATPARRESRAAGGLRLIAVGRHNQDAFWRSTDRLDLCHKFAEREAPIIHTLHERHSGGQWNGSQKRLKGVVIRRLGTHKLLADLPAAASRWSPRWMRLPDRLLIELLRKSVPDLVSFHRAHADARSTRRRPDSPVRPRG